MKINLEKNGGNKLATDMNKQPINIIDEDDIDYQKVY